MLPHWSVPPTWEDPCKLHLVFICIFSYLSRWGTCYVHGDGDVRRSLVEFAQEKLLCAQLEKLGTFTNAQIYAILSQCLALDSDTTKYFFHSPDPNSAVKAMHEQIARHMRVCMAIDNGIETLRGITPSEPILSEAASRIMTSDKFSLLATLDVVLNKYYINQGDCEELVVAALFTSACDQVVKNETRLTGQLCSYFSVTNLFKHLFAESGCKMMFESNPSLHHVDDSSLPFGTAFNNASMHFNHFIRPQEQGALGLPYLLHFMARGAAALGVNCRPLHSVYPFLYNTTMLDINKVGFIIVQVGNRSTQSGSRFLDDMFSKMDPFDCGLIKDLKDGRFPIPIIRIIFLLSGDGSGDNNYFRQHTSSIDRKKARFTSYDFVCSGITDILLPTQGVSPKWRELLDGAGGWGSLYDVGEPNILRSQLPASAKHAGHYTSWSDKVSLFEDFN
jgi:hypothetical protein